MIRTQKRIALWLLERSSEAALISLLMLIIPGPAHFGLFTAFVFGFFATLAFFLATGYCFTTAIADYFLRLRPSWLYPAVVAALFCFHLQVFFFVAHGWTNRDRTVLTLAGMFIVLVCSGFGSFLQRRWIAERSPAPPLHTAA